MIIGVPREIKPNENRVGVVPSGVELLVKNGHTVLVETNAGVGSGFQDDDYVRAGARMVNSPADVYGEAEMIVKVKEPIQPEYSLIRPDLLNLQLNSIRTYRDEFRRNIDYTVLVFILIWGLNVVDASVDAHLKSFDVSPDLSFRMKVGPSPMSGTTGISFILALK